MTDLDRLAHQGRWRHRPVAEKVLLSFGLLILALVSPPFPGGALALAAAVLCALAWARVPPAAWFAAMLPPLAFVALGAAAALVSLDGRLEIARAAAMAVRGTAGTACLILLATTTPATDLMRGARRLGLSAEIAELALMTYRFVFLLNETAHAIHASQAARLGYDGFRRSATSLGLLIAALLPRALDRARRLEIGLAARGFDGGLPTLTAAPAATARGLAGVGLVLVAVTAGALW